MWLAGPPDAPAPAAPSDDGWQALLVAAHRHGVTPLLHRRIVEARPGRAIPAGTARFLERSRQASGLRAGVVAAQLRELLDALARARIPAHPLKGAYLGAVVYGDPALRPMNDLDLLVPAEQVAPARRVAEGLGYVEKDRALTRIDHDRHHHAAPLLRPGALPLELHHAIVRPGAEVLLPPDALRARARPSPALGGAPALAAEDVLLHLALHLAHGHRFRLRLLHVCDVAELARRTPEGFAWDRFVENANAAGAGRFAYAALAAARAVLDAPVPPDVLAALSHAEADERVLDDARVLLLSEVEDVPRSDRPHPIDALRRRGRAAWARLHGEEDAEARLARSRRAVDRWVLGAARRDGERADG